jgi:hypothetical protein
MIVESLRKLAAARLRRVAQLRLVSHHEAAGLVAVGKKISIVNPTCSRGTV